MKKLLISLSILALFLFVMLPADDVEARQGCCSWHGGVCGCRCCDGTPLSAKCAPYYPQCGAKSTPKYEPLPPKYEPPALKGEPSTPHYDLPSTEKYTAEIPKRDSSNGGSIWWWIIGIGVVGYIIYAFSKRKG